jgi:hypothetical protein
MTKTFRVILIDPVERHISELESDCTLDSIHKLVDAPGLDSFSLASYEDNGRDIGWIDDVGLSGGKPVHAFLLPTVKDPFAGRCLVIGATPVGETCSARLPIALLRQDVTWIGSILPEVHWDNTETGARAIVTYSRLK